MNSLTNKKWNSLTQVRDHLQSKFPEEKITYFDGIVLKTSKYVYTLAFEQLKMEKNGK